MSTFSNFNNFDSYFLNDFQGMESNEKNKTLLREKIESLYISDKDVQYSTNGLSFEIWNSFEGSLLTINFN
jgi:hypothetical protein